MDTRRNCLCYEFSVRKQRKMQAPNTNCDSSAYESKLLSPTAEELRPAFGLTKSLVDTLEFMNGTPSREFTSGLLTGPPVQF